MHGDSVHTFGHPKRWMRPVSLRDMPELKARSEADGHAVIAPTHVFARGSDLVGYASVGVVPLVLPWFDTKRCAAADSLYFINVIENLAAGLMQPKANGLICVPVMEGSPFEPYIEKLGYVNAGKGTVTFKKVS